MDQVNVHFKQLLNTAKVGTIACIDNDGWPFQALVPYAVWPQVQCFVIHISSLAKHTRNLLQRPKAALSIFDAFSAEQSVHELPRISFQVRAQVVERSAALFEQADRKSTRLNSSHVAISYAVFCVRKKKDTRTNQRE